MEAGPPSTRAASVDRERTRRTGRHHEAYAARHEALKIAFAPLVFQATKVMRDAGILSALVDAGDEGVTFAQLRESSGFSRYALRVLLDSGETSGILTLSFKGELDDEPTAYSTQVAYFLESDELTRVQFDFSADVCYEGMQYLEESLRESKPAGLKVFGTWPTVYQALSELPAKVKKAWLDFDHFFSDEAFGTLIAQIGQQKPASILDVGGNTGRLSREMLDTLPEVKVTIADLPQQIAMANAASSAYVSAKRLDFYPTDVLSDDPLPTGHDAIVMSQFLDCFSEEEIIKIVSKAHAALNDGGKLYILETLIDRQKYSPAKFCVAQISLYFTAIANGNSQMYRYATLHNCLAEAGFKIAASQDQIGRGHTMLVCERAPK